MRRKKEEKKTLPTIEECRKKAVAKKKALAEQGKSLRLEEMQSEIQETSLRLEDMQREIQDLSSVSHRYYIHNVRIKKALLKYLEEDDDRTNGIIETIGFFILGATLIQIIVLVILYNL